MSYKAEWPGRLRSAGRTLFKDANSTTIELFKIMVPIIIVVKLLKELGLVNYLALPLEPVMELMGLPAQTGLVWATSMIVNIYSGLVVYAALLPDMQPVTVAQVTILATVVLIAHNLPVELRIAQRCGLNLKAQALLRVLGAFAAGILLHLLLDGFGLLQGQSVMLFTPEDSDPTLPAWCLGQLRTLAGIYVIIFALITLVRLLQFLRITDLLNRLLRPLLHLMGIGSQAATITVLGLTLGLAYGGGLIIHEVRKGTVPHKDVFASMSLMGLTHSLIEDTLLMSLIGAHTLGTIWFRLGFSLLVMIMLTRIYARWSSSPRDASQLQHPSSI